MSFQVAAIIVLTLAQLPAKPDARAPRVPAGTRLETVYSEWAKGARETADASKRMNKKAAQKKAWQAKTAKAKEDKLRQRFGWSQYDMFIVLKIGLKEKWPTERPEDVAFVESAVAQRQAKLDEIVLDEEIDKWISEHSSRPAAGGSTSISGLRASIQSGIMEDAELRKRVPITLCPELLLGGKKCGRKTVGDSGDRCYEHRPTEAGRK